MRHHPTSPLRLLAAVALGVMVGAGAVGAWTTHHAGAEARAAELARIEAAAQRAETAARTAAAMLRLSMEAAALTTGAAAAVLDALGAAPPVADGPDRDSDTPADPSTDADPEDSPPDPSSSSGMGDA